MASAVDGTSGPPPPVAPHPIPSIASQNIHSATHTLNYTGNGTERQNISYEAVLDRTSGSQPSFAIQYS